MARIPANVLNQLSFDAWLAEAQRSQQQQPPQVDPMSQEGVQAGIADMLRRGGASPQLRGVPGEPQAGPPPVLLQDELNRVQDVDESADFVSRLEGGPATRQAEIHGFKPGDRVTSFEDIGTKNIEDHIRAARSLMPLGEYQRQNPDVNPYVPRMPSLTPTPGYPAFERASRGREKADARTAVGDLLARGGPVPDAAGLSEAFPDIPQENLDAAMRFHSSRQRRSDSKAERQERVSQRQMGGGGLDPSQIPMLMALAGDPRMYQAQQGGRGDMSDILAIMGLEQGNRQLDATISAEAQNRTANTITAAQTGTPNISTALKFFAPGPDQNIGVGNVELDRLVASWYSDRSWWENRSEKDIRTTAAEIEDRLNSEGTAEDMGSIARDAATRWREEALRKRRDLKSGPGSLFGWMPDPWQPRVGQDPRDISEPEQ